MILAAGRGERLRPLTDTTPKPLVEVGGKALIEWHLENLATAGFREVVINTGHLGAQLPERLGEGERWGLQIRYSPEPPEALETGGGMLQALPLLGPGPFLAINGDIWTRYPLHQLRNLKCDNAHLVLVPNPPHHPNGDFALLSGRVRRSGGPLHTYSGIAVYHPCLFAGRESGRWSVAPLLKEKMESALLTGELYRGDWFDPGTPERLAALREQLGLT